MKSTQLGEFEELVLLIVGSLTDDAYSISIKKEFKARTGRNPSIGALHSALYRLEEKGFLTSNEGGATSERGGRRKKFYQITADGQKVLMDANELRMEFAKQIPGLNLSTD